MVVWMTESWNKQFFWKVRAIESVRRQEKIPISLFFQLLQRHNLLIVSVFMPVLTYNVIWVSFGLRMLVGQNKTFKNKDIALTILTISSDCTVEMTNQFI